MHLGRRVRVFFLTMLLCPQLNAAEEICTPPPDGTKFDEFARCLNKKVSDLAEMNDLLVERLNALIALTDSKIEDRIKASSEKIFERSKVFSGVGYCPKGSRAVTPRTCDKDERAELGQDGVMRCLANNGTIGYAAVLCQHEWE